MWEWNGPACLPPREKELPHREDQKLHMGHAHPNSINCFPIKLLQHVRSQLPFSLMSNKVQALAIKRDFLSFLLLAWCLLLLPIPEHEFWGWRGSIHSHCLHSPGICALRSSGSLKQELILKLNLKLAFLPNFHCGLTLGEGLLPHGRRENTRLFILLLHRAIHLITREKNSSKNEGKPIRF